MGCTLLYPCKERAVSGHGKAGAQNVREKMVVLPIVRSVAQIRFREGGGQGRPTSLQPTPAEPRSEPT